MAATVSPQNHCQEYINMNINLPDLDFSTTPQMGDVAFKHWLKGKIKPLALHACHCTDLNSKVALAGVSPLKEAGTGLSLHFDPMP